MARVGFAEVTGIDNFPDAHTGKSAEPTYTRGMMVRVFDVGSHPILISVRGRSICLSLDEFEQIVNEVAKHPQGGGLMPFAPLNRRKLTFFGGTDA